MTVEKRNLETAHIALRKAYEAEQSLTARIRIHIAYVAIARELDLCPVCHERARDLTQRKDAKGEHWCKTCIDEFDNIDWSKIIEDRLDNP